MANLSVEKRIQVWDDDAGTYVEVGPDHDGLGLIQITQVYSKDETFIITVSKQEAILLSQAIMEVANSIDETRYANN